MTWLLVLILSFGPRLARGEAWDLTRALDTALKNNPRVAEAENNHRAATLDQAMSWSPFLPQLAIEGGHLTQSASGYEDSGPFVYGVGRWSLYSGGRDSAARETARIEFEETRTRVELARALVSRQVLRHYAEIVYLDQNIELKSAALTVNDEQRRAARRKAQGGVTSSAEVLEFDFRENALKTEIELLKHERNLAARSFSVALGAPPDARVEIRDELDVRLADHPAVALPDADQFLEKNMLTQTRSELEISKQKRRAALATWLPQADFEARYGEMRYAEPEVFEQPAWRVELKLTLPIFSGLDTLYARREASFELAAAESRLRRDDLAYQAIRADRREKLAVLETLLKMQNENILRAERYYRATLSEYRRGIKNAPDLSGATERWFDARARRLQLTKDMIMSKLGLLEAVAAELP